MTAEAMATDEARTPKRPRVVDQAQAAAGAAAANGTAERAAATAGPAPAGPSSSAADAADSGLAVPEVGEHISADELLPALRQLLGAYQVRRALHPCSLGRSAHVTDAGVCAAPVHSNDKHVPVS
jgi:hypothetical protein